MLLFTFCPITQLQTKPETFLGWLCTASVQQHTVLAHAYVVHNALLKGKVTNGFDQDEGQNCPTPCSCKILLCSKAFFSDTFPKIRRGKGRN